MKRMMVAILIVLVAWSVAYAKVDDFEIEITIEDEFLEYVDFFEVYTEVPGSGNLVKVATLQKQTGFSYQMTAIDLKAGRVNWYVGAVYGTGADSVEDLSIAFPYQNTGKPAIIRINKR